MAWAPLHKQEHGNQRENFHKQWKTEQWLIHQEACAAIHSDLTNWRNGLPGTSQSSSKERCKQPQAPEHSRGHQPENSSKEKELGVLVDAKLSRSQGSALEANMTNGILGCSRQKYSQHDEGGDPFPLLSTGESSSGLLNTRQTWTHCKGLQR